MMSYLNVDDYIVKEGEIKLHEGGPSVGFYGWQFKSPEGEDMTTEKMAAAALIHFGKMVGLKLVDMRNDE